MTAQIHMLIHLIADIQKLLDKVVQVLEEMVRNDAK